MTATTATWAIPYATGTDRLCDLASITESMARRVDDLLFAFDGDLSFLHNVPAASTSVLSQTLSQAVTGSCTSPIGTLMESEDYDTDNMVNLAVDRSIITMRRAGYFSFGGSETFTIPTITSGASYNMTIFSTYPVNVPVGQCSRDSGDTSLESISGLAFIPTTPAVGFEAEIDTEICRTSGASGANASIGVYSNMYCHWIAEV